MFLEVLRLRDFRNLRQVQIEPHPRFNILTGANGQGKTNVLEAIYLLSAVKSFRRQSANKNLIYLEGDESVLEARIERGGHERKVRLEISERGKKIFLNDEPLRNLADFFGTLNIVVFGPDDIEIIKGSPSGRRRFVDRAIFNAHPAYATETAHYEDVLKNRNALLKDSRIDENLLGVYDDQLVEWGAQILRRRLDFIEHFRPVLERVFRAIFGAGFQAHIEYDATWTPAGLVLNDACFEDLLKSALEETALEERQRQYTLIGPHRDDIHTVLNDRDLRAFGSQGQTRAFILAMKIAEITYLEERYHFAPILLLDDVSSELDRRRNHHLFDFLKKRTRGQVFITTTHRDHILLDEELKLFHVDAGAVEETEDA